MALFDIGLTDHLEGPRDRPSAEIFDEVADLVRLADELGVRYAWFAEQVAVADVLTKGRLAVGFGSGSTPEEFGLFGLEETGEPERHARFAEALRIIRAAWTHEGIGPDFAAGTGQGTDPPHRYFAVPPHRPLPGPAARPAGGSDRPNRLPMPPGATVRKNKARPRLG